MADTFRALRIEKNEDSQTMNLIDLSESDLMEGNVVVDISHSTLNYKDWLFTDCKNFSNDSGNRL